MLYWKNRNTGITVVTPYGYNHENIIARYGSSCNDWLQYDVQLLETYHMDGIIKLQVVGINANNTNIIATYTVIDYSDNDTILYCVMHNNLCIGWTHSCIGYRKIISKHSMDVYIDPCYMVIE